MAVVHGSLALVIAIAWAAGATRGLSPYLPLHVAAFVLVTTSAVAAASVAMRFPPAWSAELRRHWDERAGATATAAQP